MADTDTAAGTSDRPMPGPGDDAYRASEKAYARDESADDDAANDESANDDAGDAGSADADADSTDDGSTDDGSADDGSAATDGEAQDEERPPPPDVEPQYNDRDDLDFDPDEGLYSGTAVHGGTDIPGPHGSGKSTTVKIITGMLEPSTGSVLFDGTDTRRDMASFRRVLGYVPEEANVYLHLSGLEYLQLVGRLRGSEERPLTYRANRLLALLGLESWRHSQISAYSKGMKQRVLIAAALLHNPKLLIFDEPAIGTGCGLGAALQGPAPGAEV